MVCFGSKALQSKTPRPYTSVANTQMGGEEDFSNHRGKKKNKNRRPAKEQPHTGFRGENTNPHGGRSSKHHNDFKNPETSFLRKQVDPETTEYFTRIANLFEGNEIELEERSILCANALEETRGKEMELATDYIISHTLQTLLEGCDVDHLCSFLRNCGKSLAVIATDKSGSHVVETALRSLATHLEDNDVRDVVEETLTKICEAIVVNPVHVMCSRYGSHVLRSLLCICKGVPLDSLEKFHVTKSVLAERFNTKPSQSVGDDPHQYGFLDLLRFVVKEMLKHGRQDIAMLQVDQYSSLVLQTSLKLLVGEDQDLIQIIPILLGCSEENSIEGKFIETVAVETIVELLQNNAFSHLMEIILEVAPETLYDEILSRIFRNSLFKISCDHCGSFVVQALASSARRRNQMDLIWEELGGKFKDLLEFGRTGVVAAILATSQRLHSHEPKCCQALAAAVSLGTESPTCIVPRLLFLDSYLYSEDKSGWKWAKDNEKMHVLGCLMLQTIFKYPSEFIQSYATSIISMEPDQVLQTAKEARGGRVIESFLDSGVSAKQKRKLIVKLRGHFGELSTHLSGSFTVEKCFASSNAALKENIAFELLAARGELSKTKQGPYLLRKLDIDGFAARPDQWRSRLESKQNVYNDFYATFGSMDTKPSQEKRPRVETSHSSPPRGVKKLKKEIDQYFTSSNSALGSGLKAASMAKLGFPGTKRKNFGKDSTDDNTTKKKKKKKRK